MAKKITRQSKRFRELRGTNEYLERLAKVRAQREAKAAELRAAAPIPAKGMFTKIKR